MQPEPAPQFQAQSTTVSAITEGTPSALALKSTDAQTLLANMTQATAEQIVAEWRQARELAKKGAPKATSIATYHENSRTLEIKYSHEMNSEDGILSPVDIIRGLFLHSASISPATWRLYRSGFLYTMDERAQHFEQRGQPQPTLIRALATLIVVSAKPYGAGRPQGVRAVRDKSIPAKQFDKIITHLATAYSERNQWARRSQSFAMATIATGLRPTEWVNAVIRPALPAEVPLGEAEAGWLAVVVDTAKRKAGEPDWERTIVVEPGVYQIHVRQHYEEIQAALAARADAHDAAKSYSRRCSTALGRACKELWPDGVRGKSPIRITLYSLRHQARANVAAAYGAFVAAAMMGHSPWMGKNWYTGKHRANAYSGPRKVRNAGIPVALPGEDVLAKAAQFEQNPALLKLLAVPDDDIESERI
jgi:hypothetical protein